MPTNKLNRRAARPVTSTRAGIGFHLGLGIGLAVLSTAALAHEPIARCVQLDPQTVRCKGGYGHGEDAPGVTMDVLAHDGRTLISGKLDEESTLTFARPNERFYVIFDVGPGHQAIVEDDEIQPPPANAKARWMQPGPQTTVATGTTGKPSVSQQ